MLKVGKVEGESKKRNNCRRIVFSLMLAAVMLLAVVPSAFATKIYTPVGTGSGVTGDPYIVTATGVDNTAPSQFWGVVSGAGNNTLTNSAVGSFAVKFVTNNNYGSSMTFDMSTNDINTGTAVTTEGIIRGPLYGASLSDLAQGIPGSYYSNPIDITGTPVQVWNGYWTYAFRLCPYATFGGSYTDSSNQTYPALAFNWKGSFYTYFNDWDFTFNATSLLNASEGQTITLVHYGDYVAEQTSRGTDYTVDFTETDDILTYGGGLYSVPAITGYSVSATVNADGTVTFPGIKYGGNYYITVS